MNKTHPIQQHRVKVKLETKTSSVCTAMFSRVCIKKKFNHLQRGLTFPKKGEQTMLQYI